MKIFLFAVLLGVVGLLFIKIKDILNQYKTLEVEDKVANSTLVLEKSENGIEKFLLVVEDDQNSERGIAIKEVYLFIFNENSGKLLILDIPGWVYTEAYGTTVAKDISIADTAYLGNLVNQRDTYAYAIWNLENNLALRFNSYVWVGSEAAGIYNKEFATGDLVGLENLQGLLSIFNLSNLLLKSSSIEPLAGNVYSNLTTLEMYERLGLFKQLINDGDPEVIDLVEEGMTTPETLSSGESVQYYAYKEIDRELQKNVTVFRSRDVEKEQTKVEVYNGSDVSGLASRYTRFVRNSGLSVVRADNSPEKYQRTTLYVANLERYENSVELLKGLLPVEPAVVTSRPGFLTTGDIVLVLGEDMGGYEVWR